MKKFLKEFRRLGKKYGYFNLVKIIIFEILNFKFDKIYEYKIDKPNSVGAEYYVPSFFFVLWIIKRKINLAKKIFIDFGSGKGRVLRYFIKDAKDVIGIEYNENYKNNLPVNLSNKVMWEDCYNNSFIEEMLEKYKGEELVIYFYHPFEETRINEIIQKFICKFNNLTIVLIGEINLNVENRKKCLNIYSNKNLIKIFSINKN